MREEFWQARWNENRIGFHESQANELLVAHFHHLNCKAGDTVFIPLCGKTLDIDWLLKQGIRIIGVEFNQQAVEEVFARQNRVPEITQTGSLLRYRSEKITLFVGDIFNLHADHLGKVDGVYDRAALVAVAREMRPNYAKHIDLLCKSAPQLLITFDYDQRLMDGPPFSVPLQEVQVLYGDNYRIEFINQQEITGPIAKRCQGTEETLLLQRKQ